MLDEWVERKVDWLCIVLPRYMRPRLLHLAKWSLFWRIGLYASSAAYALSRLLEPIKSEKEMYLFLDEAAEHIGSFSGWLTQGVKEKVRIVVLLDDRGASLRMISLLFLLLLSALGTLAVGGREMAVCAASICLMWLSACMETGYAPVSAQVRQKYLFAALLRAASLCLLLLDFFTRYLARGIQNNVVLQGTMIIALTGHAVLFLTTIALNTRQNLLLRVLSGVLGMAPALSCASAIALAVSGVGQTSMLAAAGILSAAGALLAFCGDRLMDAVSLGGIRLKYNALWIGLLICGGFLLMLLGAWLTAGA